MEINIKKKQKIQNLKPFLLIGIITFILCLLPYVNSLEITNGTIINSTGLNTTINITSTIYLNAISINNNSIYFENFSRTELTEYLTFNITISNKRYFGTNLPYFNSSTNTKKIIISNINTSDSSITFSVSDCDTIGTIYYTYPNGTQVTLVNSFFERLYTCSNNLVYFNIRIDPGTTTITLLDSYGGGLTACEETVSSFISFIAFIGLIGTLLFLSLLIGYLTGLIDRDKFKQISIIGALTTLILIGVLLIIAVFIVSSLCVIY